MTERKSKQWFRLLRPRFSLRMFLLVMALIATWLAIHVQRAERQRVAIDVIRKSGGVIRYDFQFDGEVYSLEAESSIPSMLRDFLGDDFFHCVTQVDFVVYDESAKEQNIGSFVPWEQLASLSNFKRLQLAEAQATDDAFKELPKLSQLEWILVPSGSELTDLGVSYLEPMKQLKRICVCDSNLGDESLAVIATLPNLETVALQFNQFSGVGVVKLQVLDRLEELWICGNSIPGVRPPITGKTLEFILDKPNLKVLGIQHTHIKKEFVDRLKAKNPGCSVHVSF